MNHIIDVSGSMLADNCLSQACHLVEKRFEPEDRVFIVSMQMEEIDPHYSKGSLYRLIIQNKIVASGFSLSSIDIFTQKLGISGPTTFYSDDSGPIQSRRYRERFGNYIALPACPVCYIPLSSDGFERHFFLMDGDPEHNLYYIMSA
jgi:hypothetical protein